MDGSATDTSRRRFLQVMAAAGGGLLVAFYLPGGTRRAEAEAALPGAVPFDSAFAPNAWIRLATDGGVEVMVASSEMGQGVMTSIPMLAAEEMDADWSRVQAAFAPVDKAYVNPVLHQQGTGGSSAIRGFWKPVRQAGAVARALLVAAAAKRWSVDPASCTTEAGVVHHTASGRSLDYGALADAAAKLPVPEKVTLKKPSEFRIIGQPEPRLDVPAKVDGSALFGLDVRLPNAVVALVARCPVFGGKLKDFDAHRAKQVRGVRKVFAIDSGVAVVAESFWAADQGRKALEVQWDEGPNRNLDDAAIRNKLRDALPHGVDAARRGDVEHAFGQAAQVIEATYEVPFLAHACMEPMNCTVHLHRDGCDVWVPTQFQGSTQRTAMAITGLPAEKVHVHTTFLGGGFGRRSEQDFVAEAVQIAKRAGVPVKLMWTREDDTRHDFYRPATYNHLQAALDKAGNLIAWRHRIAGPSIMARVFPHAVKHGIDPTSVEGAANLPYAVPNLHVTYAMVDTGVPVGFWRSVGSSQNAFITEAFFDQVAARAKRDPLALRRALLAHQPRHRRVLELAAEKAGWGGTLPEGRHRGIAVAEAFGSYAAQVAEISLEGGMPRVHRVVCAIDCGTVVNPNTIHAQMESGIVFGLSAALRGEITLADGRVQQGNFNDYPLLRMNEMPEVEVHIIAEGEPPGGIGEPGTPPIAPAVVNAMFAATGHPVQRLPIVGGG